MKKHFNRLLSALLALLMIAGGFTFTVGASSYPDVSTVEGATISEIKVNEPLDYEVGEDIVFKFQILSSNSTVVTAPYLYYSAVMDDGRTLAGYVEPVDGVYTVTLAGGLLRPGFVFMTVNACDENKGGLSVPSYKCGAGAGVDDIHPIYGIPSEYDTYGDFDAFWDETLAQLDAEGGEATLQYIYYCGEYTYSGTTYDCYEIEVNCPKDSYYDSINGNWCGTNYVSAYLTIPQGKTNLGLQLLYKGYDLISASGSGTSIVPQANICAADKITLSVSPHSVPAPHNVAEADIGSEWVSNGAYIGNYYRGKDYGGGYLCNTYGYTNNHGKNTAENASPYTTYFKYMIMRDVQAANFLKMYFGEEGVASTVNGVDTSAWAGLWDGTNLKTYGGSQGGFQALAVAGLVPEVNEVDASIPWFADQGVNSADSERYKPTHPRTSDYCEGLRYMDTANFAAGINPDCNVTINAGLIDTLVPPSTVVSIYDMMNCNVSLTFHQNKGHGTGGTVVYTQTLTKTADTSAKERVVNFMGEVDSTVSDAFAQAWTEVSGEAVVSGGDSSVDIYVVDKNTDIDFTALAASSDAEAIGIILTGDGLTNINEKLAEIYALHNDVSCKVWVIGNDGTIDGENAAITLSACMNRGNKPTGGASLALYGTDGVMGQSFVLTESEPYAVIPSPLFVAGQGIIVETENITLDGGFMSPAGENGSMTFSVPSCSATFENVNVGDVEDCGNVEGVGLWVYDAGKLTIKGAGAMPSYASTADAPWAGKEVTEIEITDGITSLGANNFAEFTATVNLPKSVDTIDTAAIGEGSTIVSYDNAYAKTFAANNGFTFTNLGAVGTMGDDVYWHLDTKTGVFTVSGTGTAMYAQDDDGNKVAPSSAWTEANWSKAQYYPYRDSIKKMVIEAPIKSIQNYSLTFVNKCTTIELPEAYTGANTIAFHGMSGLTCIYTKGQTPEAGTANLSNLTVIGDYSMVQTAVAKVILNDSVKALGKQVFHSCKKLAEINIPESLTSIGTQAFYKCSALTSITLPASLTSVDATAFYGCTNLASLTVKNSSLDMSFAAELTGLELIVAPEGSTAEAYAIKNSIPFEAYEEDVSVDAIVTDMPIGEDLYFRILLNEDGETYTMDIYGTGVKAQAMSTDGEYLAAGYASFVSTGAYQTTNYYEYSSKITKIKFSAPNITTISGYMFQSIPATELELHANMTALNNDAFNGMTALRTAYTTGQTPEAGVANLTNVSTIGGYVFYCHKFTKILLSDELTSIGAYTFASDSASASGLESVEIPSTVTSIGANAFLNAGKLVYIKFGAGSFTYDAANSFKGINANATVIAADGSTGETLTSELGIRFIDSALVPEVYNYYTKDDSAVIIAKISGTEYHAFGTGSAAEFNMGYTTYDNAISSSTGNGENRPWNEIKTLIKKVVFVNPELVSIDATFATHTGLVTVEVPASLTSLGDNAFNGSRVATLYITGNEPETGVVDLRNVTSLGGMCLAHVRATSILLSDDLTGTWGNNLFFQCTNVEYIRIPKGVTKLDQAPFNGIVNSLTTILVENPDLVFPNLASYDPFRGASNLSTIIGYKGSTAETYAEAKGLTFIPIDAAGVLTFEGFRIRESDYNGLRSIYNANLTEISSRAASGLTVVEYGSILASTEKLAEYGDELTVWEDETGAIVTHSYVSRVAVYKDGNIVSRILSQDDASVTYAYTVTHFNANNYNREITSRGYVIFADKEGNQYIAYADLLDDNGNSYNSMSLETLCQNMADDGTDLSTNVCWLDILRFREANSSAA